MCFLHKNVPCASRVPRAETRWSGWSGWCCRPSCCSWARAPSRSRSPGEDTRPAATWPPAPTTPPGCARTAGTRATASADNGKSSVITRKRLKCRNLRNTKRRKEQCYPHWEKSPTSKTGATTTADKGNDRCLRVLNFTVKRLELPELSSWETSLCKQCSLSESGAENRPRCVAISHPAESVRLLP